MDHRYIGSIQNVHNRTKDLSLRIVCEINKYIFNKYLNNKLYSHLQYNAIEKLQLHYIRY